ncbi:MAG: ABC transporter permease subunit [Alphaproteobacteria bacterium]|nr:ABC transporter permease subunit [Alphaproteobacteria bacterium]
MVDYSLQYLDRSEESRIDQQIEAQYIELQQTQSALRRVGRALEAAAADAAPALERQAAQLDAEIAEIEETIAALENRYVEAEPVYSLANYEYLFTNSLHRAIFLKTIWATALVTFAALVLCYPIAFYLAKVAPGERAGMLMLALIIPYWINEILRTFAWLMILSYNGIFNQAFTGLGVISEPIDFLNQNMGVIIGMTYTYILFMVFPIYNTIDTLDKNQLEAARDLGAPWWRIHWRIVIPHAKPGIAVGCIMTFMLAAGSYAVPQILGGTSSLWFTQIIYNWFFEGGDWNVGSAYAFLLLIICVLFILAMMRLFRVGLNEISR